MSTPCVMFNIHAITLLWKIFGKIFIPTIGVVRPFVGTPFQLNLIPKYKLANSTRIKKKTQT